MVLRKCPSNGTGWSMPAEEGCDSIHFFFCFGSGVVPVASVTMAEAAQIHTKQSSHILSHHTGSTTCLFWSAWPAQQYWGGPGGSIPKAPWLRARTASRHHLVVVSLKLPELQLPAVHTEGGMRTYLTGCHLCVGCLAQCLAHNKCFINTSS